VSVERSTPTEPWVAQESIPPTVGDQLGAGARGITAIGGGLIAFAVLGVLPWWAAGGLLGLFTMLIWRTASWRRTVAYRPLREGAIEWASIARLTTDVVRARGRKDPEQIEHAIVAITTDGDAQAWLFLDWASAEEALVAWRAEVDAARDGR
jgi:hypothetical protein